MEAQASYQIIVYAGPMLPKSYEAMVYSKWLRSLRYGNDYFKLIDQDSYFRVYHKYIEHILSNPLCTVRLATLADDPDCVLGFSVSRSNVLDYVHVHKDYRRTRIATNLLPPLGVDYITHITKQGMSFWNARLKEAKFDPFR